MDAFASETGGGGSSPNNLASNKALQITHYIREVPKFLCGTSSSWSYLLFHVF